MLWGRFILHEWVIQTRLHRFWVIFIRTPYKLKKVNKFNKGTHKSPNSMSSFHPNFLTVFPLYYSFPYRYFGVSSFFWVAGIVKNNIWYYECLWIIDLNNVGFVVSKDLVFWFLKNDLKKNIKPIVFVITFRENDQESMRNVIVA